MITAGTADAVQITGQRSYGRRYRHLVIVEHNNQPALEMARLVNRFHRHTTSQRRVADQRNYVMILIVFIASDRHPGFGRKRRRNVAGAKSVVFRFVTTQETTDAAILFDGRQK